MTLTRRQLIGLLGVAGLSGCTALGGQQEEFAPISNAGLNETADGGTEAAQQDAEPTELVTGETSADIVFWRDTEHRKHARARDGHSLSGWEFADVLQSGLDYVAETFGGGVALVSHGYYELTAPVTVPKDVQLNTAPGGILSNHLTDELTPCLTLLQKSSTDHLVVDANGGTGVLIGESDTFNNMRLGFIKVYGASDTVTDAGGVASIEVRGYNIKWDHLDVNGGAVALRIAGADIFGTSAMLVNAAVGVDIDYAEHVVLNDTIVDSITDVGMWIDHAHDLTVRSSVWFNAQLFSASPRYGVVVGRERECSHLRLELSHMAHGGTAVSLDRVRNSLVSVLVTNDRKTGPEIPFEVGLETTAKTADSVVISGYVDPTIPTPLSVVGGTVTL